MNTVHSHNSLRHAEQNPEFTFNYNIHKWHIKILNVPFEVKNAKIFCTFIFMHSSASYFINLNLILLLPLNPEILRLLFHSISHANTYISLYIFFFWLDLSIESRR